MAAPWRLGCRHPRKQEPTWITRRRSWLPCFGSQSFPKSNTWHSPPILDCHHVDVFRTHVPSHSQGCAWRFTPWKAFSISSMVGSGWFRSSVYMLMTIPGVQNPHWEPWLLAILSLKRKREREIKKTDVPWLCYQEPLIAAPLQFTQSCGGHHQVTKPLWGTVTQPMTYSQGFKNMTHRKLFPSFSLFSPFFLLFTGDWP